MKKIVVLLSSIILFAFCLGSTIYAIEPRWNNTGSLAYVFEFDDSCTGNASASVTGKIGTSKIECKIEVYRQNGTEWIYVKGDTQTVNDGSMNMELLVNGNSGQYYKAEFTFTVWRNGTSEVITFTDYATCP